MVDYHAILAQLWLLERNGFSFFIFQSAEFRYDVEATLRTSKIPASYHLGTYLNVPKCAQTLNKTLSAIEFGSNARTACAEIPNDKSTRKLRVTLIWLAGGDAGAKLLSSRQTTQPTNEAFGFCFIFTKCFCLLRIILLYIRCFGSGAPGLEKKWNLNFIFLLWKPLKAFRVLFRPHRRTQTASGMRAVRTQCLENVFWVKSVASPASIRHRRWRLKSYFGYWHMACGRPATVCFSRRPESGQPKYFIDNFVCWALRSTRVIIIRSRATATPSPRMCSALAVNGQARIAYFSSLVTAESHSDRSLCGDPSFHSK